MGSILGQGSKILCATWCGQKERKEGRKKKNGRKEGRKERKEGRKKRKEGRKKGIYKNPKPEGLEP